MFNKTNLFGREEALRRRENSYPNGAAVKSPLAGETPANKTPSTLPGRSAAENTPPGAKSSAPAAEMAKPLATAAKESAETASEADIRGARLIVGPEVKLRGAEILDCDTLVVEGRVEATMDSRVIRITEHGSFAGKVSIDVAEIHGSFEGELTARSQLIIHSTGRVRGKICYGKLVADEGCELCGDVSMLGSAEKETRAALSAAG